MFNPLLEAFRNLDGSGRNDELAQEVVRIMGLGDDVAAIPHGKGEAMSSGKIKGHEKSSVPSRDPIPMLEYLSDARKGISLALCGS
jgi:hypothetical protein